MPLAAPDGKRSQLGGWLTVLAGLLLSAVVVVQAVSLERLGLEEAARDEARGLAASLRARLELDRAMLDLNGPGMRRALDQLGGWPHSLESAGLYEPDGRELSATAGAPAPAGAELEALARARPEEMPVVKALGGRKFLALTRLKVGAREMVLAMGLAPQGWRPGAARIWSAMVIDLAALAGAALFLALRGAAQALAARRAASGCRPPPQI